MDRDHLAHLCADFKIGIPLAIEENQEGVLNRNYVLTTDTGKYFIKLIREKRRTEIQYIAVVETFMRDRGIPAVCMLTTTEGQKSVTCGSEMYTLYPFLESVRYHTFESADFIRMGEMLGRIHLTGSENIPEILRAKSWKKKTKDEIRERLLYFRVHILGLEDRTEIDTEFLSYIDLKFDALEIFADQTPLPPATRIHGDYHAGNLLMNADRDIIGVCDWELSDMSARAVELARSILYICFNNETDAGSCAHDLETAITSAQFFIAGYSSVFPIGNDELVAGLQIRIRKTVHSAWIEEQYYERRDNRSNKFVQSEMRLIQDFRDGSLIERLKQ